MPVWNINAPVAVCNIAVHSVCGVEVDNIPWRKRDSINKNLNKTAKRREREREREERGKGNQRESTLLEMAAF